jgi:vacuolar protein sorting-associated protein 72
MSDDDERPGSSSGSDDEDVATTGLIATRAKRSTAGNLYATLRQNLDDEELQKELLAEEEEDVGDYEGTDRDDDDDAAMDSSSDDDEDAGPPKDGEAEDLEGEKQLKKAEREAARKKRKMDEARMRLPAWQKKKKVKLADDAKTDDGSAPKPKKKSERSNWLPTAADLPSRQSTRTSAVEFRTHVHENLKLSNVRSENQKKVMANHIQKSKANKRADLTQEERFAKAARIEKETAREFGRWEREEAERQRIRDEQLAAKRRRNIEGPVIQFWSGSVIWEGDKIKVKRVHQNGKVEEVKEEDEVKDGKAGGGKGGKDKEKPKQGDGDVSMVNADDAKVEKVAVAENGTAPASESAPEQNFTLPTGEDADSKATSNPNATSTATAPVDVAVVPSSIEQPLQSSEASQPTEPAQPQSSWLDGIHAYAANSEPTTPSSQLQAASPSQPGPASVYLPSAPSVTAGPPAVPSKLQHLALTSQSTPVSHASGQSTPQPYNGWPGAPTQPTFQQFQLSQQPAPPPPPPEPLLREHAQRSLLILSQFPSLAAPTTSRGKSGPKVKETQLDATPLSETLNPGSHPPFNADETRYLLGKLRKKGTVVDTRTGEVSLLPQAPPKAVCALTSWPAKFKDPRTGLPYADLPTYKMIKRMLAGGCAWSGVLGAWVGPRYGEMGRPAKGVPEGFGEARPRPVIHAEAKVDEGMKMEVDG